MSENGENGHPKVHVDGGCSEEEIGSVEMYILNVNIKMQSRRIAFHLRLIVLSRGAVRNVWVQGNMYEVNLSQIKFQFFQFVRQ